MPGPGDQHAAADSQGRLSISLSEPDIESATLLTGTEKAPSPTQDTLTRLHGILFVLLPLGHDDPNVTTALLAGAAAAIFGFLALFWSSATTVLGARGAAVRIAFVSSVGALGAALSPTFIGWTKDLTGSFTGAVDTLAGVMLVAMAVLWFCLPRAPEAQRVAEPIATG